MMPFLAAAGDNNLSSILIPVIVVTLSMTIPIVAIIADRFQKRDRMRLIEKAIEHGANLADLNLEDPNESPRPRLPYRAGMINLAVGLALIVGHRILQSHLAAADLNHLSLPLLLGGLIVSFIGLAMLVNDWMNRDRLGSPTK